MLDEQQLEQEKQITLKDYLHILHRGRWIILSSFVTVMAATIYFTYSTTPVYQASTKVIIKDDGSVGAGLFEVGSLIKKETMINNQVEILKSRTLAETVIQRLKESELAGQLKILNNGSNDDSEPGLLASMTKAISGLFNGEEPEPARGHGHSFDASVNILRNSIVIAPISSTDMIEIRVDANDPNEAAFIANTLTQSYTEMNRRMSQEEVRQVKNFLDEQLQIVQDQLASSENALKNFQEKERVVALSEETNELIKNLAEFEALYNEALTELNSNRERLAYLNTQLGRSKESFDIQSISSTPYLEEMKKQLAELETQKASLIANLMSEGIDYREHPKHKRLTEQIEVLTERFKEKIAELATQEIINPVAMSEKLWARKIEVEAEIEALKPKVSSLKAIVDEYAGQLTQLPEKSLRLAQLERSAKVDEKIYIMMKEKYQESQITEVGQLGDVRIIDPAKPPKYPIKPRKRMNLMLGMMVGLGLGIGLTFLIEAMDNSVRVMEDLSKIGLSALGAIPEIKQEETLKRIKVAPNSSLNGTTSQEDAREMATRLITHFAPKSPVSEAYRSLRTNIQFSKIDKTMQTLLITSPGPGEGKSTTVANLAITMAQMGSRVLLVDADLRRPVQHTIFKLDRRVGLTNALVGRATVDEAVKETEIENMFVMPCGTLPPNPSELLGSTAMKNLIDELKSRFDVVLFDSPPVIAVTDAAVLCRKIDGVVLVAKSGQTDRNAASHAFSLLKNVGTNLLGGLLNSVKVESMYGSYYYYYQYYHYYYGKDDQRQKRNKKKSGRFSQFFSS